jgi:hypothetical protein
MFFELIATVSQQVNGKVSKKQGKPEDLPNIVIDSNFGKKVSDHVRNFFLLFYLSENHKLYNRL